MGKVGGKKIGAQVNADKDIDPYLSSGLVCILFLTALVSTPLEKFRSSGYIMRLVTVAYCLNGD